MISKTPNHIHSTTTQSFSHGRSRLVQVERICSIGEESAASGKMVFRGGKVVVLDIPDKKAKNIKSNNTQSKSKKCKRKKTAKSQKQKKMPAKPSFLKSTRPRPGELQALKSGRPLSRGSFGGGLSAGLPGNEETDPPLSFSQSSPADRYHEQQFHYRNRKDKT